MQFYTLSPVSASGQAAVASGLPSKRALGVGPVVFPEFLDRPQIVTRSTSNRLEVDEFHRWGGSLQEDFSRTLVQNLSSLLNTNRVHVYPSREQLDLTHRVTIDVQQFEGSLGGSVTLNAVWTLVDERTVEPLMVRRFELRAPTSGTSYEALVAAHSTAVGALGNDIATAIRTLRGR